MDNKLVKLGWKDANFWDSLFDSATSQKPAAEDEDKVEFVILEY